MEYGDHVRLKHFDLASWQYQTWFLHVSDSFLLLAGQSWLPVLTWGAIDVSITQISRMQIAEV